MQQDPFYQNVHPNQRMQFPNTNPAPFSIQPNPGPWSGNYVPQTNMIHPADVPSVYNCGSELSSTVPPLSSTAYDSTSTLAWAHTVPSLMPWVTQGQATVSDPIVRFTAPFPPDPCTSQTATSWELLNNLGSNRTCTNMHLKRKSDIDMLETEAPPKLCITEEKMAARFREMHISNRYSIPEAQSDLDLSSNSSQNSFSNKSATTLKQFEEMLKESSSHGDFSSKSLILAPELKKLVEPEKIFKSTFLDKVERPSMAVVVWKPPEKILGSINNNSSESEPGDKSSSNNNFFSQHCSAMRNANATFKIDGMSEATSLYSEDVMDT